MKKAFLLFIIGFVCSLLLIGTTLDYYDVVNGDLLAYYGAILGGSLTLIGVWCTIKSQEKERHQNKMKEILMQNHPIILPKNKPKFTLHDNHLTIFIELENKTSSIAKDHEILNVHSYINKHETDSFNVSESHDDLDFFNCNNNYTIHTGCIIQKNICQRISNRVATIKIKINLLYHNIYGMPVVSQIVFLTNISFNEDGIVEKNSITNTNVQFKIINDEAAIKEIKKDTNKRFKYFIDNSPYETH